MTAQTFIQDASIRFGVIAANVKRLPVIFWRNVIFAIALLWVVHNLARLFWVLIPAPELASPQVIALAPVAGGERSSAYSVDLIAMQAEQIFGEGAAEPIVEPVVEQEQVEDDVEKTRLNLKLVGLLVSSDQAQATATIAEGSKQAIYNIDEKLPGGTNVKLAKVLPDRVILNNNGNFEALWLYSEADFNVTYSSRPSASRSEVEEAETAARDPQRIEASIQPSQIPKSISDVVKFSVHRKDGQMIGFRVRPGRNKALFDQLGLQANDVVTSVNGIAIDNTQAIRDNYQQLKSATTADLEIQRGEELLYINVALDTLSE